MRKLLISCLLLAAALVFGPACQAQAGGKTMVTLQTTKGDIVLELDAEKAPNTTRNFLEYVKSGFYDGTIFHVNPNNIAFIGVVRSDTCDLVDRFTLVEPRR